MARKGNQQRNGLDRNASKPKFTVSGSAGESLQEKKEKVKAYEGDFIGEDELPNVNRQCRPSSPSGERINKKKYSGDGKKNNQRSLNVSIKEKSGDNRTPGSRDTEGNASELRDDGDDGISPESNRDSRNSNISTGCLGHGLPAEDMMNDSGSSEAVAARSLGDSALSILKVATGWLEKQKPLFATLTTILFGVRDYVRLKTEHAYPIILRWLVHFGKLMLLLSMVWLDCSLRGLDSLLRMGTTSFFMVIWCSVLSVIAMIGILKFLLVMAAAGLVALFIGFTLTILVVAIFATIFLWMYGSFWTTGSFIFVGGVTFALSHERLALFITTAYSMYCAKGYVGWLGLLLGINLSFISSDVLVHFLKNNINEHRSNNSPEQSGQTRDRPGHFYGEPGHASQSDDAFGTASGRSEERNPGVPSTSGADTELTSEDEVVRLLNCNDHYSALGLSRYENIDVSLLKREYRKKAMLVHPDKNMGNEKAVEAFKKLQNAYEVLLDSFKRKAYDDELRREELLNYFRRFQGASQKNGQNGIFASGFAHFEADDEDPHGDSRRIACKKCDNFHIWALTERSKSRARWCQDCNDFHQAKDGDGWVEQSFHPFLFGLLQKVDAPSAYVCAESRIYDATEWFICQGMRCPANTHKPSFHVNTSVTAKHNNAKGTSSAHKSGGMPSANMDESMKEEEFFEWLQNAVQSGIFEASNPSTESPSARTGSSSKSTSGKKKKKGKKQW
ncbi:chaperone DnaJ-domain superfamily protein [Tasmannia lanceolata]|uniref:chaperone DnaJ-domain superfamily protein n=1 Tax=Tasmannia lanceolata TaxID=3420 RepID=UPI0040649378